MNLKISFLDCAQNEGFGRLLLVGDHPLDSAVVARVGITEGIARLLRIDIAEAHEFVCFKDLRLIGTKAFIGFGARVFVVDVVTEHVALHAMDGYFGAFFDCEELEYSGDDFALLASSASELLAFDINGALLWKASQLGIDGVLVHKVTADRIEGGRRMGPAGRVAAICAGIANWPTMAYLTRK